MNPLYLSVSHASPGVIRVQSDSLFGDPEGPACRRFIERAFHSKVISSVEITGGYAPRADLRYCPRTFVLRDVLRRLEGLLGRDQAGDPGFAAREARTTRFASAKARVQ